MKKILIIIPAYNEEENIGLLLNGMSVMGIKEFMDVLVIDDGSLDHTAQIAEDSGFKVIRLIFNMGYGAALQTAYKYAAANDYEYLLQIDADGQHDLSNIKTVCERLGCFASEKGGHPDIVIGSRFLEGSKSFHISAMKKCAISCFRWIIRRVTGQSLTDPTSGLQGLNRRAFSFYSRYNNFDLKYPDLNMIVQMLLLGFKIEEVPAVMCERTAGESMHSSWLKAGKYMILMLLGTWNAYVRCKTGSRT